MSLTAILEELPQLSFAERQEIIRRAIELDEDAPLSAAEEAILDERMEDFARQPEAGVPLEQLKDRLLDRIRRK